MEIDQRKAERIVPIWGDHETKRFTPRTRIERLVQLRFNLLAERLQFLRFAVEQFDLAMRGAAFVAK